MSPSINFISEFDSSIASFRSRILRLYEYIASIQSNVGLNDFDKDYDIVVIQKGNLHFLYEQFKKYKKEHKFIIFDIDDYHDNRHKFFIKHADLVVVGSSFLKNIWHNLNKNIVVLDDPVDVYNPDIPLKKFKKHTFKKIGWFGNDSNLPALQKTGLSGVTTITRNGDIEWSPETVDTNIQKFDLIVLPQDIHSNCGAAKGNCRMLKALYLGIPVMVSDLPAYVDLANLVHYPSEFIVHDNENWNQKLEHIRSLQYKFDFDFAKCRKTIIDNYSFSARGKHWMELIMPYYINRRKHFIKRILFNLHTVEFFKKIRNGNKRTIILLGFIKINYKKRVKNG